MSRLPTFRYVLLFSLAAGARSASGATPCDDGLALADTDPFHGAAAIELCDVSVGASAGVVSAAYRTGDLVTGLDQAANGFTGVGLLDDFGLNVSPRRGARMLALSTGTARTPADPGYGGSDYAKSYQSIPPAGYPADVPGCPPNGAVYDSAALVLDLVAPPWAHSFSFDFKFYTADHPSWVCGSFNDQFVALSSPARLGSVNGNLVFDSAAAPMTVNSAEFLTVCDGCASGTADLDGTGFAANGATPWLRTRAPVDPGEAFTLSFVVWDVGDALVDSSVLLDDFRWSASELAGPTTQVAPEPESAGVGAAALAALATLGRRRGRRRAARGHTLHPQGETIR